MPETGVIKNEIVDSLYIRFADCPLKTERWSWQQLIGATFKWLFVSSSNPKTATTELQETTVDSTWVSLEVSQSPGCVHWSAERLGDAKECECVIQVPHGKFSGWE